VRRKAGICAEGDSNEEVCHNANETADCSGISSGEKRGVDPKVAADQRGHGLGVSMDVYTQSDLDQKLRAVQALE
jgi:hypothetical protein